MDTVTAIEGESWRPFYTASSGQRANVEMVCSFPKETKAMGECACSAAAQHTVTHTLAFY